MDKIFPIKFKLILPMAVSMAIGSTSIKDTFSAFISTTVKKLILVFMRKYGSPY